MPDKETDKNKENDLRRRAEQKLDRTPDDISKLSGIEIQRIVQDLSVHQIEPELQNEELQRAYVELKQARDKYADLYDFAPVGYVTISTTITTAAILNANLTVCQLLNIDRRNLLGGRFSNYIDRQSMDTFYLSQKRAFETRMKQICKVLMHRADGTPFYARLELISSDEDQLRIAVIDITEEKLVKDELAKAKNDLEKKVQERTLELQQSYSKLQDSEEKYRRIVENTGEGILSIDRDRIVTFVNSRGAEMLGYTVQEVLGKSLLDFIDPDYRQKLVFEHKNKLVPSFTNYYNIHKLVYYEVFEDPYNAITREKRIKGGSKQKKLDLINAMNPGWKDIYKEVCS